MDTYVSPAVPVPVTGKWCEWSTARVGQIIAKAAQNLTGSDEAQAIPVGKKPSSITGLHADIGLAIAVLITNNRQEWRSCGVEQIIAEIRERKTLISKPCASAGCHVPTTVRGLCA